VILWTLLSGILMLAVPIVVAPINSGDTSYANLTIMYPFGFLSSSIILAMLVRDSTFYVASMKQVVAISLGVATLALVVVTQLGILDPNRLNSEAIGNTSRAAGISYVEDEVTFNPSVGDVIMFGGHDWRILEIRDDDLLLLSEYILFSRPYHNSREAVTWETSSLRHYLNNNFYNRFSSYDQSRIVESTSINNSNPWFEPRGWLNTQGEGGANTTDRIFLLSIEEVVRFLGDSGTLRDGSRDFTLSDHYDRARVARDSDSNTVRWWLRSPGASLSMSDPNQFAIHVNENGTINVYGRDVYPRGTSPGVRPAMWVNLNSP